MKTQTVGGVAGGRSVIVSSLLTVPTYPHHSSQVGWRPLIGGGDLFPRPVVGG
ncbi:hypothetical protein Q604_UNBC03634G0001, partial [human gut metagenome]